MGPCPFKQCLSVCFSKLIGYCLLRQDSKLYTTFDATLLQGCKYSLIMSRTVRDSRVRQPHKKIIGENYVEGLKAAAKRGQYSILSDFTPEQYDELEKHFDVLPQRYAQDVNRRGYHPIQHFLLLQSARKAPEKVLAVVKRVRKRDDTEADPLAPSFGSSATILLDAAPGSLSLGADRGGKLTPSPSFLVGTPDLPSDSQVRPFLLV
jgi:hypothetical protein